MKKYLIILIGLCFFLAPKAFAVSLSLSPATVVTGNEGSVMVSGTVGGGGGWCYLYNGSGVEFFNTGCNPQGGVTWASLGLPMGLTPAVYTLWNGSYHDSGCLSGVGGCSTGVGATLTVTGGAPNPPTVSIAKTTLAVARGTLTIQ